MWIVPIQALPRVPLVYGWCIACAQFQFIAHRGWPFAMLHLGAEAFRSQRIIATNPRSTDNLTQSRTRWNL